MNFQDYQPMMRYDYYFTFKAIGIFMINCNYVLCRCKKKKLQIRGETENNRIKMTKKLKS